MKFILENLLCDSFRKITFLGAVEHPLSWTYHDNRPWRIVDRLLRTSATSYIKISIVDHESDDIVKEAKKK